MTDVRLYSASGAEMELEKMQLCLAYAYGDGKETSCENTLASLSRIFYNIPFSAYVSLNWDSIAPLNDAINGVEVTALENVQTESSMIYKNQTVTLMGKDAWSYVKYRDTSRLDSNIDRLNRQKQYINAYISKLIPMAKKDFSVATGLISTANQYMYSNISTNQLVYIVSEILPTVYSAKDFDFVTIDGKIKQGETYAEFYPDETSLYESILKVFYTKIS
jgi:anionic cell wall polymer biosynthesis LytR-Cps2A-Psr (LCP) family protein